MDSRSLEGAWIAVHVRTRHESAVAKQLIIRGYESFAPLRTIYAAGKRKLRAEALFPGYIFCKYKTAHPFRIVQAPAVIGIVGINGTPQVVDELEIEAVRRAVQSGLEPESWDSVVIGARVRVRSGPLEGFEGTLIDVENGTKLLISVSVIQKHIAVDARTIEVVSFMH